MTSDATSSTQKQLVAEDDSPVCCPRCGGNQLQRLEVTLIGSLLIHVNFGCDDCDGVSTLTLETPKGQAFLGWERAR